ncbi:MAG: hypothetical protein LUH07_10490 [Lachnospiraceae bacterium]|nr:hypothetical protein [Lachnospiraceae bacterium]
MCANGVNTEQFLQMIDMVDDHIALEYRWAHRLAHTAGDGGYSATSDKLHEVQAMLADVRSLLDEAKDSFEGEALTAGASTATVHMV